MRRVAVIGAGITGLAAAYRLITSGRGMDVRVFEASDRVGGKIQTHALDEFLVEAGADTFLARKPEGIGLCRQLGLEDRVVPTRADTRRAFVCRGDRLYRIPDGMSGLVPGRLGPLFRSPLLTTIGKARAACEPLIRSRATADETIAGFVARRFGRQVFDRLIEPLLCGIYGGDGERLGVHAAAPALVALEREHGSVLRGVRRDRRADETPSPGFVSLRSGMSELTERLANALGDAVRTRRAIDRVRPVEGGWRLDGCDEGRVFEAVIVTVPSARAAQLVRPLEGGAADRLTGLDAASTATVSLAFRRSDVDHPLDGYGYVIPAREGRLALACSWTSSKLFDRAPAGTVLLRVFLGRDGRDPLAHDDHALAAEARAEINRVVGIRGDPILVRVFRYPAGMPQYRPGHERQIRDIRAALDRLNGFEIAGCSYDGVGIPDCIASGWGAADRLLARSAQREAMVHG